MKLIFLNVVVSITVFFSGMVYAGNPAPLYSAPVHLGGGRPSKPIVKTKPKSTNTTPVTTKTTETTTPVETTATQTHTPRTTTPADSNDFDFGSTDTTTQQQPVVTPNTMQPSIQPVATTTTPSPTTATPPVTTVSTPSGTSDSSFDF